jgi:hypothetical protein
MGNSSTKSEQQQMMPRLTVMCRPLASASLPPC